MSYLHVHTQPTWATTDDLQLSRSAARAHALQQAVAESRTTRPRPVAVWRRARLAVRRLRPA